MRAVVCESFDREPILSDMPEPVAGPGQVLVRQRFSSIGAGDRLMATGRPRAFRPVFSALMRPPVLGRDVAGEVIAVGDGVDGVKPGDVVIGEAGQAWAEQVAVPAHALAVVPADLDLARAAALPVSGLTALQGLRRGEVKAGSRVLIVGASGAVGHLAVQIAAHLGATVTAVCSGRHAGFARELGAHEVLDYTRERFTDREAGWDCVFDLAGAEPLGACLGALRPGGRYVSSAGTDGGPWLGPLPRILGTALRALVDSRTLVLNTAAEPDGLRTLAGWVADGTLVPHVDIQPLADAPREVFGAHHGPGKVVISVGAP